MIYLELFAVFFVIGAFTIGGGYAMLSLIQNQVVTQHQWISEQAFTDIVAVSQMTPGPIGINSATYIGYSVLEAMDAPFFLCFLGSLTATFAVVLPSFIIVLYMAKLYDKFKNNLIFKGTMEFVRPSVVGLIAAAAVLLMTKENFVDWTSFIIFGVAFASTMWFKANPILVIICAGVVGCIIY